MRRSQEMKAELNALIGASKALMNKDGATAAEINAKAGEIEALKAKIAMQESIEAEESKDVGNQMKTGEVVAVIGSGLTSETSKDTYTNAFYNALTGRPLTAEQKDLLLKNALSSTSGTDGGYLIPIDQQVAIRELKRDFRSLEVLVNVESVNTLTGNRNIEKFAEHTPFANLAAEGDTIADTDTPQFLNIPYAIKDYAGILPVPNNLLNDTSALQAYLMRWLAKKDVATRNYLILTLLNTLSKTAFDDIDDIKDVLNVTLDTAIASNSMIVMNQDAFNKYDKMKDTLGKPLLQPMVTDPTKLTLAGKEIMVFSNRILKTRSVTVGQTTTNYAPVIVGNLKEAITLFDRQAISILSTNIGAGAFEKNQTKFRPIIRLDVQKVDTAAVVFGEIVV